MATKSTTAERARPASEPGTLVLLCLAAWAIPGAGHFPHIEEPAALIERVSGFMRERRG